jgi:hypothetical protein
MPDPAPIWGTFNYEKLAFPVRSFKDNSFGQVVPKSTITAFVFDGRIER